MFNNLIFNFKQMENIKNVVWYTLGDLSCIWIVTIIDKNTKEDKSYIWIWYWFNEEEDIKKILEFWARFFKN